MATVDLTGIPHTGSSEQIMILYTNRESLMKGTYIDGTISEVIGVNNTDQPAGGIQHEYSQYFTKETVGGDLNLWRFEAPRDGTFSFYAGQSILRWSDATAEVTGGSLGNWNTHSTGNNADHTASVTMTEGQYVYFNCANTVWTYNNSSTGGAGFIKIMYTPEPPNVLPISLFNANNDEGMQYQITDYSSDPDGTVNFWEFDMDVTSGAGKYLATNSGETPINITRYLKFDRNATTTVGNTIAGAPPATFYYRYNAESNKMITLKVTDDRGGVHNSSLSDALPASNLLPSAGFSFMAARDNRTVDFKDISADLDGEIVSWVWDFNDGNTTTWTTRPANGEFQHTYAADGSYDVTLTVTDNIGGTNTVTQTVDAPRVNANVVFTTSGPVSFGFSVVSGTSATMPSTDFYRGPSFLAWSRTLDVIGTDADKENYVFKSVRSVTTGLNATQKTAYHEAAKHIGYPRDPLSLKALTQTASTDYKVDYMSPSDAEAPFSVSEWIDAEIPPPAIETPNPPNIAIGNGMFSVGFDSQTYFKIWIDTSGSMGSYVGPYASAAISVQADLKDLFFGGDATLARKYVKPSQNISNERWGTWGGTTLHEPGEPKKEVMIAAINEDRSGGQGNSNASLLAKAQEYFDSGGHFYYIVIAPPGGGSSGNLYTSAPALAGTRVQGPGGEQIRWCQWSRESANHGALTNVIKQLLGLLPA